MEEQKIALLIDSDNISAKYIKYILDEISQYGIVTYKRIYGDWTSPQTTSWKKELLENSINPIQQFSNTTGKNATDSALIIDAMDILYTNRVDAFCIVSSDSDFTRLASRLRESGMGVIGMGEKKTPQSFRAACTKFTTLDILLDHDLQLKSGEEIQDVIVPEEMLSKANEMQTLDKKKNQKVADKAVTGKSKPDAIKKQEKEGEEEPDSTIYKHVIESAIVTIITENANKGHDTELGEIGSRLVKNYPDFDVRNYGYSLLSKFLEEFKIFNLKKKNNSITVEITDNSNMKQELDDYAIELVKRKGAEGIQLGELSNKIHLKYKSFNVKDYGFNSFQKYVQKIPNIEILEGKQGQKEAFYRVD